MEANQVGLSGPMESLERHALVEQDGLNLLRRLARVYFEEEVEEVLEARHGLVRSDRQRVLDEDEADLYYNDRDDWKGV